MRRVSDVERFDGRDRQNAAHLVPTDPCGVGVAVLAGSSGSLPTARAQLLADAGANAVALRWFGGRDQHVVPYEIELELFISVLDELAPSVDRLGILGASFGAEAALSVAARYDALDAVVAIAPTTHVWPGRTPDGRTTSHWTWEGEPLPFVPMATSWTPDADPPEFRKWYEASLLEAVDADAAQIPVHEFAGELVLVAGGDDRVWPSDTWATDIRRRRELAGRDTVVVVHDAAGHRPTLPGEDEPPGGLRMGRGGSAQADARLGAAAWPHIAAALGVRN